METQYDNELNLLPVYVQCTWANAYTVPGRVRANCIQSYDRATINKFIGRYGLTNQNNLKKHTGWSGMKYTLNQVGYLTGNYMEDANDEVWFEVHLLLSDRMRRGWMKYNDIWFASKGVAPNAKDWQFIPYTPPVVNEDGTITVPEKKTSAFGWITALITAYSIFK